jgi:hypothetical protein
VSQKAGPYLRNPPHTIQIVPYPSVNFLSEWPIGYSAFCMWSNPLHRICGGRPNTTSLYDVVIQTVVLQWTPQDSESDSNCMKATLLLAGLVALSALASAQARLGWTLSQCVAKYGPYTISTEHMTMYHFHVDHFKISVILKDDRVASIGYSKDENIPLTPAEVDELKAKNGSDYGVVWSNNPTVTDESGIHRVSWDATKPGADPNEDALNAFYVSIPEVHSYTLVIRTKAEALYLDKQNALPNKLEGL